jgi:Flp pilus assembly protein TadG
MLHSARSILRRLATETRGAEIAEAAAVLPLMFMMLLGIFWFGQAFSIYGAITRAAQEGARAGSVPYCATCAGTDKLPQYAINATNATQNALIASKLDPNVTRIPPTQTTTTCLNNSLGVLPACLSTSKICVQAPIQLTSPNPDATQVCGMSVSFQYPFQFWLPFTSLNQQKIWLTASARVRMETR